MGKKWQPLQPGDRVYILAPAAKTQDSAADLRQCCEFLARWELVPVYSEQLFGQGPLYYPFANTHEARYTDLVRALTTPDIKAIWCFRGGYGCDFILKQLHKNPPTPPTQPILFIGFSDITLLHGYFTQQTDWQWSTLHAPVLGQLAFNYISADDVQTLKNVLFGQTQQLKIPLTPINSAAKVAGTITGPIVGGNSSLLRSSLSTPWEISCRDAIVLLEEVGEEPRRVAAVLNQLLAQHLRQARAIILGDFIYSQSEKSTDECQILLLEAIYDAIHDCTIPILSCPGIGHGTNNHPIPLNTTTEITLGPEALLTCHTGVAFPVTA